jgi:class 3 adenylate cyclase
VDYTARCNSLDPEDLADEIRIFQTICSTIAEKHQGHICDYLGDGLLVLFGHPHASEFAPQSSILAAHGMIAEIETNNQRGQWKFHEPMRIRIGIATGLVVVSKRTGTDGNSNEIVAGKPPILAARLQSIARPNTIVASLRTRRLAADRFHFKSLGNHYLKGYPAPISAWQVLGEFTDRHRYRILSKRTTSKFVGRDQELLLLARHFESAKQGDSKIVHVYGDAGIGKTRLLRVFQKRLHKKNVEKLWIRCSPCYSNTPLRALTDEIHRWLRIGFEDDDIVKRQKLRSNLDRLGISGDDNYLALYELLTPGMTKGSGAENTNTVVYHQQFIRFLSGLLFRLAGSRPLLLIIEDLHWCDSTTLELLTFIVRNAPGKGLFSIVTSRPEFSPPWQQGNTAINLELDRLDHSESVRLLKALTNGIPLPREIEHTIVTKCDGIPLYIEECGRNILDQIQKQSGLPGPEVDFYVPDTLQDSLNARLDKLGGARALAQLAAVFGTYFTCSEVTKLAIQVGIDTHSNMDILLRSDLLKKISSQRDDEYTFRHSMFKDAAYQSLLKKTRQYYHRQIAEYFISKDPGIVNEQPELLAYHYSRSDQPAIAVEFRIKAGDVAIARSAVNEAIHHTEKGLEVASKLPDIPATREYRLRLLLNLAICLTFRSRYYGNRAIDTYRKCVTLANEVGKLEQQYDALYGYWRCLLCQADFHRARKISGELILLGESSGNPALKMTSAGIHAVTRTFSGKFRSGARHFDKFSGSCSQKGGEMIGEKFGQNSYITIQGMRAVNSLIRGKSRNSAVELDRALVAARKSGHPCLTTESLRIAAIHAQLRHDMDALRFHASEGIELSRKHGFGGLFTAFSVLLQFGDIMESGNSRSLDSIGQLIESYRKNHALLHYPYFVGLLAQTCLHMNRYRDAFSHANNALSVVETHGENWTKVPLLLTRAESAFRGKIADQQALDLWYGQAEKLALRQGARLFLHQVRQTRLKARQEGSEHHLKVPVNHVVPVEV